MRNARGLNHSVDFNRNPQLLAANAKWGNNQDLVESAGRSPDGRVDEPLATVDTTKRQSDDERLESNDTSFMAIDRDLLSNKLRVMRQFKPQFPGSDGSRFRNFVTNT